MKVEFHPAAAAELHAAVDYYEARIADLGNQFFAEVQHMCSPLTDLQGLGPKIDSVHRRVFSTPLSVRVDLSGEFFSCADRRLGS